MDTKQQRLSDCAVAGDWALVGIPPHLRGYCVEQVRREQVRREQVRCQSWRGDPSVEVPGNSLAQVGRQGDAVCWIVTPLSDVN
jgi:hypothetical protein